MKNRIARTTSLLAVSFCVLILFTSNASAMWLARCSSSGSVEVSMDGGSNWAGTGAACGPGIIFKLEVGDKPSSVSPAGRRFLSLLESNAQKVAPKRLTETEANVANKAFTEARNVEVIYLNRKDVSPSLKLFFSKVDPQWETASLKDFILDKERDKQGSLAYFSAGARISGSLVLEKIPNFQPKDRSKMITINLPSEVELVLVDKATGKELSRVRPQANGDFEFPPLAFRDSNGKGCTEDAETKKCSAKSVVVKVRLGGGNQPGKRVMGTPEKIAGIFEYLPPDKVVLSHIDECDTTLGIVRAKRRTD